MTIIPIPNSIQVLSNCGEGISREAAGLLCSTKLSVTWRLIAHTCPLFTFSCSFFARYGQTRNRRPMGQALISRTTMKKLGLELWPVSFNRVRGWDLVDEDCHGLHPFRDMAQIGSQ